MYSQIHTTYHQKRSFVDLIPSAEFCNQICQFLRYLDEYLAMLIFLCFHCVFFLLLIYYLLVLCCMCVLSQLSLLHLKPPFWSQNILRLLSLLCSLYSRLSSLLGSCLIFAFRASDWGKPATQKHFLQKRSLLKEWMNQFVALLTKEKRQE